MSGASSLNGLTSSAISMVIAGNTGVTPFLTLLIIALLERSDPDLLNMQGKLEEYLASDTGIAILSTVTVLEFLSMCIPIVDEMVDAGMTFIIPIISAIASASTFGLFLQRDDDNSSEGRLLQEGGGGGVSWIGPLQVFLMLVGIILALSIHFFKMIVRLIGQGWLTGCLTVMETIWTISTIFIVLYIQPIAIVLAIVICLAAGYGVYRLILRIKKRRADAAAAGTQPQPPPKLEGAQAAVGGGGAAAVYTSAAAATATAPDSTYDDGLFPAVLTDVELGSTKQEKKHWSEQ
jgi:Domain of unknown function (DUF4126)